MLDSNLRFKVDSVILSKAPDQSVGETVFSNRWSMGHFDPDGGPK